jgi:archaellum component FlaC
MEILYIGLGILSSIFIFLLGYSVSGVFNGQKKVNELTEQVKTMGVDLGHIEEHIHIRINTDTNHLQTNIDRVEEELVAVEKELVALLDSRLDKLEARIRKDIPITNDDLLKEMNEIKDAFRQMRLTL